MATSNDNLDRSVDQTVDELWLLGQPTLQRYLDFVKEKVVDGRSQSRTSLIEEWRTANDVYYELERSEAGEAERVQIRDLDAGLNRLTDQVRGDARFRRAFDDLPSRFAIVELDRLMVSQPHVEMTHTARLQSKLGIAPTDEDIFRFCLPIDGGEAPVRMQRLGSRRFVFWSRSSDFRFHEAVSLQPEQIQEHEPFGSLGCVLGLMVGYGSNFLNAIELDGRLLLHNGHHRAYALRSAGVTHAPCLLRKVTRRDELNLVASTDTAADPGFYFKAARPPLLKDFFNPSLRKMLKVRRLLRAVEITFETKEYEMQAFQAD